MINLSTQVQQLEMKADVLEHENKQLKGLLCKVIAGKSPNKLNLSDNFQIVPTWQSKEICELSIMDNYNLIATKKL